MNFVNPTYQDSFDKNGYFIIPNFLDEIQLNKVENIYNKLGVESLSGMYSNILYKDQLTNKMIDKSLVEIYEPSVKSHFLNYCIAGGSFILKGTGENSVSMLHQDWNLVDENKFKSVFVWCPLLDVDETNGCLQLLPGTHKWFNSIRSINMPSVCISFDDVKPLLTAVPVKKGSAVIFAHNLFHGSFPNKSNQVRPVGAVSIFTEGAQGIHYYKVDVEIHVLNAERFFLETLGDLLKKQETKLDVLHKIPFDSNRIVTKEIFMEYYRNKLT